MPKESLDTVLKYIHRIATMAEHNEPGDAELLDRFAAARDERAFALLVWRHGPMVFGLCQRTLRHEQDAEDVFQATFLALARKAGSIAKKESLASWLYKVAYRIACRVRARTPPRTNQPSFADDLPARAADPDLVWREVRLVLDEEVARLPNSYGQAIILCYLEGKTHEEAAQLLGCPKGTLAARLARARERLCRRLTQRGLTLSAAGLAAALVQNASAAVPAPMVHTTTVAALAYATGQAVLSVKAAALAEGVLQMMWFSKMKFVTAIVLALVLTGSGVGLLATTWAVPNAEKAETNPPPAAQGDSAEIAKLRAEIAKLRLELDAVLKEIKSVKALLREKDGAADTGPLYKGKPVHYWLEQFKDADEIFRKDAITAIGVLAQRKKDLIPVLLSALKYDSSRQVQDCAAIALAEMGEEVRPKIEELLKDKDSVTARRGAAVTLGLMRGAAKNSVALLAQALKDPDLVVRKRVVYALRSIGPHAKAALPRLAEAFEESLTELIDKDKAIKRISLEAGSPLAQEIMTAFRYIDPRMGGIDWNPLIRLLEVGGDGKDAELLQEIARSLKKRYPPAK